jgi:hypothetical protein
MMDGIGEGGSSTQQAPGILAKRHLWAPQHPHLTSSWLQVQLSGELRVSPEPLPWAYIGSREGTIVFPAWGSTGGLTKNSIPFHSVPPFPLPASSSPSVTLTSR